MRTPTRDELEQTPISPEEERAHIRYRQHVQHALDKARIPSNLEWSLVLIDAATQILVLQGMPRDFYLMLVDEGFVFSLALLERPPTAPKKLPTRSTSAGHVTRVFNALKACRIDPSYPDAAPHLLGIAGDVFARNAFTESLFHDLCNHAYELAEARVSAMAKRNQA